MPKKRTPKPFKSYIIRTTTCVCGGDGRMVDRLCPFCFGRGYMPEFIEVPTGNPLAHFSVDKEGMLIL